MREDYHLITTILCIIYTLHNDKRMVYDGGTIKLEHLVQKSIRYQHHHLNYKESLENGFIPVTEDLFEKWNTILVDPENSLVQLLLSKSLQVVKKLDEELDSEIKNIHPNDVREKRIEFENQYENYKKKLEFRRIRKWKKVEEKQVILEQEKIKSDNVNGTVQSSITESNFPQITETEKPIEINEKPAETKLNETNITDDRKARKKIKTSTYSEVVKRTANKDIGEKITNLEEVKASLLRDSLTQAYETSPPVFLL